MLRQENSMRSTRKCLFSYFRALKSFSLVVLSYLPSIAFACSCFWPSTDRDYNVSDVVVTATVLEGGIERVNERNIVRRGEEFTIWDGSIVKLSVDKVWKGEIRNKTLPIRTSYTGGTCGYHFEENKSYILFARYIGEFEHLAKDEKIHKRFLWTSYCDANIEVEENLDTKRVIEKLEKLQKSQTERKETHKYTAALKKRITELIHSK